MTPPLYQKIRLNVNSRFSEIKNGRQTHGESLEDGPEK